MMRSILVVLALVAIAHAEFVDDVDLSTLKHRRLQVKLPFDLQNVVFDERIVGGAVVEPNSIPYQAALIITASTGTYLCGGVLVSTTHILTAGHCLVGASQVQVRLGAHYWNLNEATQQRFFTSEYKVHSGWDEELLINDIGVVTLQNEAVINEYVQVVPLPLFSDIGNTFSGYIASVSGWGVTSDAEGVPSDTLKRVQTEVITNLACNISFLGIIVPTHICTSGAFGRGACTGDSGSPLISEGKLIGVVSYALGLGCETGWPTVYSRITQYLDWIEANTDAHIGN